MPLNKSVPNQTGWESPEKPVDRLVCLSVVLQGSSFPVADTDNRMPRVVRFSFISASEWPFQLGLQLGHREVSENRCRGSLRTQ